MLSMQTKQPKYFLTTKCAIKIGLLQAMWRNVATDVWDQPQASTYMTVERAGSYRLVSVSLHCPHVHMTTLWAYLTAAAAAVGLGTVI
jgi:hypothetical protein